MVKLEPYIRSFQFLFIWSPGWIMSWCGGLDGIAGSGLWFAINYNKHRVRSQMLIVHNRNMYIMQYHMTTGFPVVLKTKILLDFLRWFRLVRTSNNLFSVYRYRVA